MLEGERSLLLAQNNGGPLDPGTGFETDEKIVGHGSAFTRGAVDGS
jgi:hypothetical protein